MRIMKYGELTEDELKFYLRDELDSFTLPPDWREDRMPVKGYAIDPGYVKDVDDAVYAEQSPEGGVLTVSIADTASFLSMPSALRTQARRNICTRYRGTQAHRPMLPTEISENMLSLREGVERPVMAVQVPFDAQGVLGPAHISRGIIRTRRLTNDEVDTFLGVSPKGEADTDSLALSALVNTTDLLYRSRTRLNPATRVLDNEDFLNPTDESRTASFVVREAMIAANRGLAQYAIQHEIPTPHRVFEMPWAANLEGEAQAEAIMAARPRALYSAEPKAHDALGLPAYVHGTSPLRRIADFILQANILAYQTNEPFPYDQQKMERVAARLNEFQMHQAERRASGQQVYQQQGPSSTQQLLERIQAEHVETPDLIDALFRQGKRDVGVVSRIRSLAMSYLEAHPQQSRQVLNTAVQKGILTIRPRQEAENFKTASVIVDSRGNVYPYEPNLSRLARKVDRRRRADTRLIGNMVGIEAPPEVISQAELKDRLGNAIAFLTVANKKFDLNLRTRKGQHDKDESTLTLSVVVDGVIYEATASAESVRAARRQASFDILTQLNYWENPQLERQSPRGAEQA